MQNHWQIGHQVYVISIALSLNTLHLSKWLLVWQEVGQWLGYIRASAECTCVSISYT